uniref:Uncharacterized protein n=1 Tax=Acrobeloides nanus TaxID=290746 RepID=A0A914E979_9BILA
MSDIINIAHIIMGKSRSIDEPDEGVYTELIRNKCSCGNNCDCENQFEKFEALSDELNQEFSDEINNPYSSNIIFGGSNNVATKSNNRLMSTRKSYDYDTNKRTKFKKRYLSLVFDILKSKYDCRPTHRSASLIFSALGNIYILFGVNDQINPDKCLDDMWGFNCSTGKYFKVKISGDKIIPTILSATSIINLDFPTIILFGGATNPTCTKLSNALYRMTFKEQNVINIQQLKFHGVTPPPMLGSSMTNIDDKTLYLIGGKTVDDYNSDIWKLKLTELDIVECELIFSSDNTRNISKPDSVYANFNETITHTNESTDNLAVSMHDHLKLQNKFIEGCAFHYLYYSEKERKILILRGHNLQSDSSFENIMSFDIEQKTFTIQQTYPDKHDGFPSKRKFYQPIIYTDHNKTTFLYINGGLVEHKNLVLNKTKRYIMSDSWKLNLRNLQWAKCKTKLKIPVFFHSAAITPVPFKFK